MTQLQQFLAKLLLIILKIYKPLTNRIRGCTVNYRQSFSPSIYDPKTQAIKSKGKIQGSSTYSKDQGEEVSKIFIIVY